MTVPGPPGPAHDPPAHDPPAHAGSAHVLLVDPPGPPPVDEAFDVDDPARGEKVEILRGRLVDLIDGVGPGLLLQPVVHIQSGKQVGAEALARFPGSMSPAEWFRTAHALGVGAELELRILRDAIGHLEQRPAGFVGVNLSPSVLLDGRSLELLRGAPDAELMIEITDQTVVPKLSVLRTRLDEVRRLDVRVAVHVSEFGDSTLQMLTIARPDVVKLDPPITAAIAASRARSAAVDELFTYCRQEGAFVIAVGVETRSQLLALQDSGVDAYQGFVVDGTPEHELGGRKPGQKRPVQP